jgi:hypothetical protein
MTRLITHNGHTDTISGWAAKNGITKVAMRQRLNRGWTIEEACSIKRIVGNSRHERAPQTSASPVTAPLVFPPFEEMKRQHLAMQRQFNSTLRQFNRDLHAIISRSLDPGVVDDLLKSPVDRSIPVTRGLPQIGNS